METLQTIALGDGSTLMDLSHGFEFEIEPDGTLSAVPSNEPEILTLRFSILIVGPKPHQKAADVDLAADLLARAPRENLQIYQHGDKAWHCEEKDSLENGVPIWLRIWIVSFRNRTVIISVCSPARLKRHLQVTKTCSLVPNWIESLRLRVEKSPLTPIESEQIDAERRLVAETLCRRYDIYSLPKLKADLVILQRVVDDNLFCAKQNREWKAFGVVFGDVIANELGLHWVAHCDEYGMEPALNLAGTSITLFPRTMILKRIEKGEPPNLEALLRDLRHCVENMQSEGY